MAIVVSLTLELTMARNAAWQPWRIDLAQMSAGSTMIAPVRLAVAGHTAMAALVTVLGEPPTGASASIRRARRSTVLAVRVRMSATSRGGARGLGCHSLGAGGSSSLRLAALSATREAPVLAPSRSWLVLGVEQSTNDWEATMNMISTKAHGFVRSLLLLLAHQRRTAVGVQPRPHGRWATGVYSTERRPGSLCVPLLGKALGV